MPVCPRCGGTGKIKDDKIIGENCKKLRNECGKSLREVGKKMGFSASYICDLEHGRRIWSSNLVESYHKALLNGGEI